MVTSPPCQTSVTFDSPCKGGLHLSVPIQLGFAFSLESSESHMSNSLKNSSNKLFSPLFMPKSTVIEPIGRVSFVSDDFRRILASCIRMTPFVWPANWAQSTPLPYSSLSRAKRSFDWERVPTWGIRDQAHN